MPAIAQNILDALTRVDMPALPAAQAVGETMDVGGLTLPVWRCQALVVGSGAAGLRAAIELQRHGVQVLVATMSAYGGTSACSGSDKQTLHTAGTSNKGDHIASLAHDIGSGGCMDHDQEYVEAAGSFAAFGVLQYLGLPLPTDRFGAVLRYQTDHDTVGRATSCGPRTSRLMVQVLAQEALRLQVGFRRKCEAVQLLIDGGRCVGVVAIDREHSSNAHGLCVILAGTTILATGGPGELYRDSVYPRHCYGSLGMALEAGVSTCNLTESQFGIGTRRQEFPWNLSGTYVQVVPRIFSRDAAGTEYNFLGDYFRTTQELASNVFRKGYQWPFHATRMLDFKSSLVDLAIAEETRRGRTVYLDFLRNPDAVPGDLPFAISRLDDDARAYLENNEALQATPLARLAHMNPLAIELYRMHGVDIAIDPLPFAVNHQHMNGGVQVDSEGQTSLPGLYAVGEVAGTHGVTRPGGAALNAGQVMGMRVARHIAWAHPVVPGALEVNAQVAQAVALATSAVGREGGLDPVQVRDQIQARMSDNAGFLCPVAAVPAALAAARELRQRILREGLSISSPARSAEVFRWRQMALTSEAVLTALDHYVADGGGSRGARAYCAADGPDVPQARAKDLSEFRFRREKAGHREHKLTVRLVDGACRIETTPLRSLDDLGRIFFEKNWSHFLTGAIHAPGFTHG
jgi:succinate dehydrogenase/fumarate reductase flavoprotein subunit